MRKKEIKILTPIEPYKLRIYKIDNVRHLSSLYNEDNTMCGIKLKNEDVIIFDSHKVDCGVCKIHVDHITRMWPVYK